MLIKKAMECKKKALYFSLIFNEEQKAKTIKFIKL